VTASTLACEGVGKNYSGLVALNDVTLSFEVGQVTALVGANGAGKTTFLDVLSGTVRASNGAIKVGGRDVTSMSAWRRARLGMLRGFQDSALFADLTVRQTLRASTYRTHRYSSLEAVFRVGRAQRCDRDVAAAIDSIAARYGLTKWLDAEIASLSLGMAKIVQLAAVSIAAPRWILLDEPAAGLARAEVEEFARLLRQTSTNTPETGYLIVEHDASLVSIAADRVILMAEGSVVEDFGRDDAGFRELLHAAPVPSAADAPAAPARQVVAGESTPPPQPASDSSHCVDARGLRVAYGKFEAVHGIDLRIEPGQLAVLVGTNGAGKSSVLNAIVGIRPPKEGVICLDGQDISGLPAHRTARQGLVLVPSGRGLMAELSVAEALRLTKSESRPGAPSIDPLELFPELKKRLRQRAGTMSGGEQQMLALARSIQLQPKYLLIDELSLGLNPMVVERLISALLHLRDQGVGLLVVEQNAPLALSYSDHAFVMNNGSLTFSGPSREAAARADLFRPVFLDPDAVA
jgi:branched-chain amino acid transport system ATP-binding protein